MRLFGLFRLRLAAAVGLLKLNAGETGLRQREPKTLGEDFVRGAVVSFTVFPDAVAHTAAHFKRHAVFEQALHLLNRLSVVFDVIPVGVEHLEAAVLLALKIRVIGAEIQNGLFFAGVLAGHRGEFFDFGSAVNDDAGGNVLEVRHLEPQ